MFVKTIICVTVLAGIVSAQDNLNKTENETTNYPSTNGFNKTTEMPLTSLPESSTSISLSSVTTEITESPVPTGSNSTASGKKKLLPGEISVPKDHVPQNHPSSCSNREKLSDTDQAIQTDFSKIKKCCPIGESLQRGANDKDFFCDTEKYHFSVEPIDAIFFEGCIEDQETKIELDIEAGNPCNMSFVYGRETGDQFYVIQNGSLLLMDHHGNDSFEIHNQYCLDLDYNSGEMIAIVCSTSVEHHVSQIQTILYAICMMMSFPCLLVAAYLCLRIKELRTLHGMCFASICYCLAVGFLLHTISQMSNNIESKLGYAVQYFMLAYFFWLFVTCLNVVLHVWLYVPFYVSMTTTIKRIHYGVYFIFAMAIPMTLVLITKAKRIPGMPSYFYQGWSESIRTSQRYFIPPVSGALFLSFIALIVAYFGFRKLRATLVIRLIERENIIANGGDQSRVPEFDGDLLEDTRFNGKSISIIVSVVIFNWILEVITFYTPAMGNFFLLDIANALQGVFILLIFITIKERQHIIARWWSDRGEHDCTEVEMTELQQKPDRV